MPSISEDQRKTLTEKLPGSGIVSLGYDADTMVLIAVTDGSSTLRSFTVFDGVSPAEFAAVCAMPKLNHKLAPMLNFKPHTQFVDATLDDYAGAKPTEFVDCPGATAD